MNASARVFVNGVGLDVPAGGTALDAVRRWDAQAADAVARGASVITDSRGLPTSADAPIRAGSIFRVIPARAPKREPGAGDRDALAP